MGERIRILRVITRLNVGGPSLHVLGLTSHLDPARFESLVVAGTVSPGEGEILELRPDLRAELGSRLLVIPELTRPLAPASDTRALRELSRVIREVRPHIVETHLAKAGTLGRLATLRHRSPATIHVFHGTSFTGHFPAPLGTLFAMWERVLARRTDRIVAVSPAVARDLAARKIGPDRVTVVPLGLDLERFAALPPLAGPPPPVVTTIARLVPVKDVPLFVEAMRLVRAHLPGVTAWVVGDGPLRDKLRSSSPPWIEWLGTRADLPAVLARSGVVVLTSRSEGSPAALIEALAAARPVVAVPVGGVVDVLAGRPGALLASHRSPGAVADGIRRALADTSLAEGAARGRAAVVDEFGITRLVAAMERLYADVLAAAHG